MVQGNVIASSTHEAISGYNPHGPTTNRYGTTPEELIELVDKLGNDKFGVCWDFGHANLSGMNQCASLEKLGSRLIALHVDDNRGFIDEHLVPYIGFVQWEPIMHMLEKIHYKGDFTYEIHNFTSGLPDALQQAAIDFSFKVGMYLLSQTNK